MKFRLLNADEIDARICVVKENGLSLLLYKNARVDQNILDETIGALNWQRDHKELKGNIYCGVGIWDIEKMQWVWKWDAGAESNTEKEKGEASDSFKRACFNWGIGRELYTAPFIWVKDFKNKYDNFKVEEIGYNDKNEIVKLKIKNLTLNKIVFELGKPIKNDDEKKISKEQIEILKKIMTSNREKQMLIYYKVEKIEDLPFKIAEIIINKIQKKTK